MLECICPHVSLCICPYAFENMSLFSCSYVLMLYWIIPYAYILMEDILTWKSENEKYFDRFIDMSLFCVAYVLMLSFICPHAFVHMSSCRTSWHDLVKTRSFQNVFVHTSLCFGAYVLMLSAFVLMLLCICPYVSFEDVNIRSSFKLVNPNTIIPS